MAEQRDLGVVGGRYRIVRPIGRGGMGAVWEVEHVVTRERFALKVIAADADRPDHRERFRREANVAARVDSENVVRVVEADVAPELDGRLFLVMELLSGCDLRNLLLERGPLPPEEVLDVLEQAARGISAAHAVGVVHRDLKAENIFLHTTKDGRRVVKVLDFGLARLIHGDPDAPRVTKTGEPIGTPYTMAPEQVRADRDSLAPASDVWSIGMTTFELLTGEPYWRGRNVAAVLTEILKGPVEPPSARAPTLPRGFDAWFFRSCARDPKARYPSVRAQIDALAEVLAPERAAARARAAPHRPLGRPRLPPARRRVSPTSVLRAAIGALAAATVVAAGVAALRGRAGRAAAPAPSAAPSAEGFVSITCVPACADVVVDGTADLGAPPLARVPLAPGPHVLDVASARGNRRVNLVVVRGETTTLRVDFE